MSRDSRKFFSELSQVLEDAISHGHIASVAAFNFVEMQGGLPIIVDGQVSRGIGASLDAVGQYMTRISQPNATATIVGFAVLCLSWPVPVLAQDNKRPADANRGAVIVAQGAAGAPACAACHAFDGTSDTTGAFPRIDGQSASYLEQQMRDFVSPNRMNAIMSPIAKALSADDIAAVAEYYARTSSQFLPLATADAEIVKKGRQLAQEGDPAKGILGCNNCHGPDGEGMPPMPYLAGQYAQYIAFTLHMWKSDFRKNSPEMMAPIAKQLDDQEIAAVAAYYQQARRPAGASK